MATATKPKAPAKITLDFDFDHETKGTFQFKEPQVGAERPAVGSMYITKEVLSKSGLGVYRKIKVTIEGVE